MLNFAEQTGSGAVIVVWSLLKNPDGRQIIDYVLVKQRETGQSLSTYL
jgi:hypothetical protein